MMRVSRPLKPIPWVLATLVVALVVRGVFLAQLPAGAPLDADTTVYLDVLRHHLWENLAYSPRKPPLFELVHAPVAWLFGDETIARYRLLTVELFLLDGAAMALLAAAAMRLRAWPPLAFAVMTLYSLCLMPLELNATHYDRPLPFFAGLFLLALARVVASRGERGLGETGMVAVSVAGALLIAQSTVASLLVPLLVVIAVVMAGPPFSFRRLAGRLALGLALPGVMLGVLVAKTHAVSGIAATANGAGHTHILFVMNMYDWKRDRVRQAAVEAGAPAWYLWCYDNPVRVDDTPDMMYARSLGSCGVDRWGDPRGADMTALLAAMVGLGDDRMAAVVREDMAIAAERPHVLPPFGTWASRWFAEYSRQNTRIAAHVFRTDTGRWLINAYNIHHNMWVREGPKSLGAYVRQMWPEPGSPIPLRRPLELANRYLETITRATYLALPEIVIVLALGLLLPPLFRARARGEDNGAASPGLWGLLSAAAAFDAMMAAAGRLSRPAFADAVAERWRTGTLSATRPSSATLGAAALTIPPVLVMTAIFCGTVGTENERFFQQALPYLCILATVIATALGRIVRAAVRG
ncbi:MAG: hypothetical protein H7840_06440 [Alphaproteobacteria bacterium]